MKKRDIKYAISYIGTIATVWTIFYKEAVSLADPLPGQIEVIAAFNIGAALLFVLAGLMNTKDEGYMYVLMFAVGSRLWTFYHISILFAGWIMWEMIALNIVVIGFEVSIFFIARGQTEDYENDVQIYKSAYDAIMNQLKTEFPDYPQLKGEPVDLYVKRIKESLDKDIEEKIRSRTKIVSNSNGTKKKRSQQNGSKQRTDEELADIYQNWLSQRKSHPSSRELASIWSCSPATAQSWRKRLGLEE